MGFKSDLDDQLVSFSALIRTAEPIFMLRRSNDVILRKKV